MRANRDLEMLSIKNNNKISNQYQVCVGSLGPLLLEEPVGAPAAHGQQHHHRHRNRRQDHPVHQVGNINS